MPVDRHIKSIKVYAQTINTDSLKIDDLKFQENLEPKKVAIIPSPYNYYNTDLGEWVFDFGFENDFVLALDDTQPTGFAWKAAGRAPTFQFTMPGVLEIGNNQPPATPVPYVITATQLYAYVKTAPVGGNVVIEVNKNGVSIGIITILSGNHTGSTVISTIFAINDVITIDINDTDYIAADLTVQVRC